jgi:small-conductance mechanosensitive channel
MEVLSYVLFEYGNFVLNVEKVLLASTSIVVTLILIFASRFFLRKKNIKNSLGISNVVLIRRFLLTGFIFIGLYAVLESIGIDAGSFLNKKIMKTEKVSIYYYHIVVFYIIIVGTRVLLSIIETIINAKELSSQIEKGKTKNVYQIVRYFIYLIAIAIFIQSLGINITILVASLSALLLGLGLGLQHLFNDFISGLILLFDRSIKIGDVVEIKDDLVGKVIKINLRTSILITRDEIEIIIPNSKFTSDSIINWTHNSIKTRFFVNVGVAYGSDVRLVEKILIDVANNHNKVSKKPTPTAQFMDFGDSSLDFRLIFYSEETFRIAKIKSDLRFEIDKAFRENNVTIPFPQRDVHFFNHSKGDL